MSVGRQYAVTGTTEKGRAFAPVCCHNSLVRLMRDIERAAVVCGKVSSHSQYACRTQKQRRQMGIFASPLLDQIPRLGPQ